MIAIRRPSKGSMRRRLGMQSGSRSEAVSKEEGARILDRQARKYLNMSGNDFKKQYRLGMIKDQDQSKVGRVAALIPFSED